MIVSSPKSERAPTEAPAPTREELLPHPVNPKPMLVEWLALPFIAAALVALALTRCDVTDTPYHLATARLAWQQGSWPTTNTFSYTHPEYPLYQQYPVYQSLLYVVFLSGGWESLSVLHLFGWTLILLMWVGWSFTPRRSAVFSLAVMIVLLGLRERMVLRPDILTMIYFVSMLFLVDLHRSGRTWSVWLMPVVLWLWVNSHQMFWIGLLLQAGYLAHVLLARYLPKSWPMNRQGSVGALWPIGASLGLSALVCLGSPIGWYVIFVPMQTFGSLHHHRQNVDEFAPFWTSPQATWLVAVSTLAGLAGFWLRRRNLVLFELFLFAIGSAMVLGALRGAAFSVAIGVGILGRALGRPAINVTEEESSADADKSSEEESAPARKKTDEPEEPAAESEPAEPEEEQPAESDTRPLTFLVPRLAAVGLTVLLCLQVYYHRWWSPARILGGSQFGVGRTLGAWPDATKEFIERYPPPGRLMNLSWYAGNTLIWDLFPRHPVFVDPRFEAYPRGFLIDALRAENDELALDQLVDRYEPNWFVGELRVPGVRFQMARLFASGGWGFVHIDPVQAILVRRSVETERYLEEHEFDPGDLAGARLTESAPDIRALEQLRLATFLAELGRPASARPWVRSARMAQQFPEVARALAMFERNHPEASEKK